MNRRIFKVLLFVCMAVSFFSCDEDEHEASEVAVFISPGMSELVSVSSGDKCRYHLDLYTTHDYVSRLEVKSFDQFQGEVLVKDTAWTSGVSSYDFVYTAPITDRDSLSVRLTFTVWDNAGSTAKVERTVLVRNREVLMDELSGIVLWAPETGRADALFFAAPSKTFNWEASPDSASADMIVDTDLAFTSVTLKSNSAAKFVRSNSFDYAAATALSVQAVYAGSRRDDVVTDLRVNDIVLVGHGDKAEGVLRVTNIIRTGDADERCVHIAFKQLHS